MRFLIAIHRWWGVMFCLLFAAWFASGIVMHFVPFPSGSEADRFAALTPIDRDVILQAPAAAVAASGISNVLRVRLMGRADGPVYLISGASGRKALRADDLGDGGVHTEQTAREIAASYARARGLDATHTGAVEQLPYDQWTVSGEFDSDRPLYRITLNDARRTDIYVSSATGDVVLVTTRKQRVLNYFGSVVHWLYPAPLRHHRQAWAALMWWLSLLGTVGAALGTVIGVMRLGDIKASRGIMAWHHWGGLVCAPIVLAWIFSGFLSMDDGLLFARHDLRADARALAGQPAWDRLPAKTVQYVPAGAREVEWFALAGHLYRRVRFRINQQLLRSEAGATPRTSLSAREIVPSAARLGRDCGAISALDANALYAAKPPIPGDPVFRIRCGDTWFDIDAATGTLLDRLDPSRRAYRWLFEGLHTLDFAPLVSRPWLRSTLIVALCLCGFAFSLTGAAIAWPRLRPAPKRGDGGIYRV